MGRRAALRRRFLGAGAAVALAAAGFALAGETGAAPGALTGTDVTLTDITSVTTDVTTNLPTTVLTVTRAVKPKPPRRQRRKRTVSTSTAATTATPPATTQPAPATTRAHPRATTIAAASTGSSGLPGWAIAGFAFAAVLIAAGLGGFYVTRIRRS